MSRASKKQLEEGMASKGVCPRLRVAIQDPLATMRKGSREALELEQAGTVSVSACEIASNGKVIFLRAFSVDFGFRERILLRSRLLDGAARVFVTWRP